MGIKEDIVRLRVEGRMTLRDIASRLDISRTRVYNVLRDAGISGTRNYPELDNSQTFINPDDVIANKLKISLSRVESARRKLDIRKVRYHNLEVRRDRFASEVFGKKPGPNFSDIADFVRNNIRQAMADKVIAFYVESREGATGYARFLRSKAFIDMKQKVTSEIVQDLVEKGMLQ